MTQGVHIGFDPVGRRTRVAQFEPRPAPAIKTAAGNGHLYVALATALAIMFLLGFLGGRASAQEAAPTRSWWSFGPAEINVGTFAHPRTKCEFNLVMTDKSYRVEENKDDKKKQICRGTK